MKYALIDMGSNSIRMTVYDINQTDFKILFKGKIMAGLAGYVENGVLTQDGIDCACHSLREFQDTLNLLHIDHLAVFATASLRNVSNTSQAVEQIRLSTGISVEVLSGETEAECGYYGASGDVKIRNGLFVDIGGASTELALFTDGELQKAESIPVGSLKLYRDCVKKIMPGKESRRHIEEAIRRAFACDALKEIPRQDHMICVGGTARATLRLCRKLYALPEDCRSITKKQLDGLARFLYKGDQSAVDLILRCEPERIHTLVPGVMILRYLVDRYSTVDVTVSSFGVREGYLSQMIQPFLADIP
ncbi:MAG: phosphatase [Faecousia sp.]